MQEERIVLYEGEEIHYFLERKPVKNLNLRVSKEGRVHVSAHPEVSVKKVDAFVAGNGKFIRSAQKRFSDRAGQAPRPKQYESGEPFYLLGQELRLKVEKAPKETVFADGACLRLWVKDPHDFAKKQKLMARYWNEMCRTVFQETILEVYPAFQKYGVPMPTLRIRDMKTRWGSCTPAKEIITLNQRLLAAPRSCIEYVVTHEFCHFLHLNHSSAFYDLLTLSMPDWKARKDVLNRNTALWIESK